jgi:galactose mutarotase-like enzyme
VLLYGLFAYLYHISAAAVTLLHRPLTSRYRFGGLLPMEISIDQKQYRTYTINYAHRQASLEIIPERGGIVTGWKLDDRRLLYLDTDRLRDPSLSVRGGIPVLFPICGNLVGDSYTLGDRQYTLQQHGFARNLPFSVIETIADKDLAIVRLRLNSSAETKLGYPFDFQFDLVYEWNGYELKIISEVTNQSNELMPCSVGFHPYFLVGNKDHLFLNIPCETYQTKDSPEKLPFLNEFDYRSPEIDIAFTDLTADTANGKEIFNSYEDLTIELRWQDPDWHALVFWTVKDREFYCLEPWTAPRNAFNTGIGLKQISPQETWKAQVSIVVAI